MLVCSGHPIGVMRTVRQYENFVLHVEWMHTEPGGNSGMFLWSGPRANPGSPFPDGVEAAIRAGVVAIAQPGGSVKDPDVIAAADRAGVAMIFTGIRHFRH